MKEEKDNKKNKNSFIVWGLIILVVIIGIVFFTGGDKFEENGQEQKEQESQEKMTEEERSKIISEARSALDPSICEKIKNEGDQKYCKDAVIIHKAEVQQDPSICDLLDRWQDTCIERASR